MGAKLSICTQDHHAFQSQNKLFSQRGFAKTAKHNQLKLNVSASSRLTLFQTQKNPHKL